VHKPSAEIALQETLRKVLTPETVDRDEAIEYCKWIAEERRRAGIPVVFRVNIAEDSDFMHIVEAARQSAPHCGLILRTKQRLPAINLCPDDTTCRLEPPLGGNHRKKVVGFHGMLKGVCRNLLDAEDGK
jgi:hypothetical protein